MDPTTDPAATSTATNTRRFPPQRHSPEVRTLAQALYLQGVTPLNISRQIQVPVNTVTNWVKRGQWLAARLRLQQNARVACNAVVSRGLLDASKTIREDLASELQHQVKLLRANPASKPGQLANRTGQQGRASVAKTLADAAAAVFCWQTETKVGLVAPMPDAPPIDVAEVRPALLADPGEPEPAEAPPPADPSELGPAVGDNPS